MTLDLFRDFINSVEDQGYFSETKKISVPIDHTPEELQKIIIDVISTYPSRNKHGVGPTFAAICKEIGMLKDRPRVREVLMKLYGEKKIDSPDDRRWYIVPQMVNHVV